MKTLLLWLAGIGGLLIILGFVTNILSVILFGRRMNQYVKYSELSSYIDGLRGAKS